MIYLDYAASAPVFEDVADEVRNVMLGQFGNPGAIHSEGGRARKLLHDSRKTIAALLGVRDREVFFTSGGTEANNWAVWSACSGSDKKHIIVSSAEHKSVLESARAMTAQGFRVSFVDPDSHGIIRPEALERALTADTCLVCVQAVNNETGVIQDIEAIAQLAHSRGAALLCDAVQSFGHVDLPLHKADYISISAHKLGGPRGVGCLAVRYPRSPRPLLFGGGQELGLRSGTENIPGIAGFALAAQLSEAMREDETRRLRALSDELVAKLRAAAPLLQVNGEGAPRHPGKISCRFPGISAEEMTTFLDLAGICVSPGAACAARQTQPSHVLVAMGFSQQHASESVRFSIGRLTTSDDITKTAAAVERIIHGRKGV